MDYATKRPQTQESIIRTGNYWQHWQHRPVNSGVGPDLPTILTVLRGRYLKPRTSESKYTVD